MDAQASKSASTNNKQGKHLCGDDAQGGANDAEQPQQPLSPEDEGILFLLFTNI